MISITRSPTPREGLDVRMYARCRIGKGFSGNSKRQVCCPLLRCIWYFLRVTGLSGDAEALMEHVRWSGSIEVRGA